MKVPLLDLKQQYNALKPELDAALIKVAESQMFILGKEVEDFEAECSAYLGVKYSYGVSSGTDALLLALMACDIKAGDEVIVPSYSFFATAGAVSRLNAVPVFVDSDPVTFNIDATKIREKVTSKTKAIIPVHLYGQSSDMNTIMEVAREFDLRVIEDGAQAISSQYSDGRCAGTIGDIGCYSFFPSKNLGCFGDGGLVVTNDEHLAKQLKILRVHGAEPKYYHKYIGGNFRIDALQAAVLRVKLPHLDSWSEKRRQNAELYSKLFVENGLAEETGKIVFDEKNSVLLPKAVYKESGHKNYHIYNQYIIRVQKRDALWEFLKANDIGCEVYYPVPFHKQECFAEVESSKDVYPVADEAASTSLALPIYPELTTEQITFVVEKIAEFMKQ